MDQHTEKLVKTIVVSPTMASDALLYLDYTIAVLIGLEGCLSFDTEEYKLVHEALAVVHPDFIKSAEKRFYSELEESK